MFYRFGNPVQSRGRAKLPAKSKTIFYSAQVLNRGYKPFVSQDSYQMKEANITSTLKQTIDKCRMQWDEDETKMISRKSLMRHLHATDGGP